MPDYVAITPYGVSPSSLISILRHTCSMPPGRLIYAVAADFVAIRHDCLHAASAFFVYFRLRHDADTAILCHAIRRLRHLFFRCRQHFSLRLIFIARDAMQEDTLRER